MNVNTKVIEPQSKPTSFKDIPVGGWFYWNDSCWNKVAEGKTYINGCTFNVIKGNAQYCFGPNDQVVRLEIDSYDKKTNTLIFEKV